MEKQQQERMKEKKIPRQAMMVWDDRTDMGDKWLTVQTRESGDRVLRNLYLHWLPKKAKPLYKRSHSDACPYMYCKVLLKCPSLLRPPLSIM